MVPETLQDQAAGLGGAKDASRGFVQEGSAMRGVRLGSCGGVMLRFEADL